MYLVRDKQNKIILFTNPASLEEKLTPKQVYPYYDAKTMEILKTDMDRLPQYYNVDAKGFVTPMSVEEMAANGFLIFGEELIGYVPYTDQDNPSLINDWHIRLVQLALKLNLIKTMEQCQHAFRMLDDEFEARVAKSYRPGMETKILKDYVAWMDEGKPAGDKREQKYLDMTQAIETLKNEYKEVRAKLKEIITPLKEQEVK